MRSTLLDDRALKHLTYTKKRDDITIKGVEVMPLLGGFATYDVRGYGELSLNVTFTFGTSPKRVRTERFNVYLRDLPPEFFTLVNAALGFEYDEETDR